MSEKIEDFKFSNWEDYAKTLEAENEKLRLTIDQLKICLELGDDQKFYEILTQAPPEGESDG